MNYEPLVSVIIPVYNQAKLVKRAIDSILSQSYHNYEIIVVNDGSTDNLLTVLEPYGPTIKLISQVNAGLAAARNRGIQSSQGELVAFLDSDDRWLPHKLERQVAFLKRHPEIDLVHCDFQIEDEQGQITQSSNFMPYHLLKTAFLERELITNSIGVLTVCVQRKALPSSGPFDETMLSAEDWDLWVRLICEGRKIAYLPEVLASYRLGSQSLSTKSEAMLTAKARVLEHVLAHSLDFLAPIQAKRVKQQAVTYQLIWKAASSYRRQQEDEAFQYLQSLVETCCAAGLPLNLLANFARQLTIINHLPLENQLQAELNIIDLTTKNIDFSRCGMNLSQTRRITRMLNYWAKGLIWRGYNRWRGYQYLGQALLVNPSLLWEKDLIRIAYQIVLGKLKLIQYRLANYKLT